MRSLTLLPAAVAFFLLAGCTCGDPNAPPPCEADSDCVGANMRCDLPTKTCKKKGSCPETPCASGETCAVGRCYPNDCTSVMCADDQVCSSGRCVDLVCIQTPCSSGKTCIKGMCYESQCALEQCLSGEICQNGTCTAGSCATVTCPSGQRCAAGMCQPTSCGATACAPTQVCVSGSCIEDRCVSVTCPQGQRCAQGLCRDIDCGGTMCPMGQVCDGQQCVDILCATVQCPSSYRCDRGLCAPGLPDGGAVRGPDGGVLTTPCRASACPELACQDGFDNDSNGRSDCEDDSCAGFTCADTNPCTVGETCRLGTCTPASTLTCTQPPPSACFGGEACKGDGTCYFPVQVGMSCGGASVCYLDGGCSPMMGLGPFPYTPSNFDPSSVPAPPPGDTFVPNGVYITVDTTAGTTVGNWGPNPPSVGMVNVLGGAGQATILSMRNLDFPLDSGIFVTGTRPLIIAVLGDTNFEGFISAEAHMQDAGPGGNASNCTSGNGAAGSATAGGGGAGSSGVGGSGAPGSAGGNTVSGGGGHGGPTTLIGGCSGGRGGTNALGGGGGGAIQISTSQLLFFTGSINVSGGGGRGGAPGGGGGAGSGGIIILEGSIVGSTSGALLANGGGGGEGSGTDGTGVNGNDGISMSDAGTLGGTGGSTWGGNGGNGGVRFFGVRPGVAGTTDGGGTGNGGGGGGAPGYIRINVPNGMLDGGISACSLSPATVVSPRLSSNNGGECTNGNP